MPLSKHFLNFWKCFDSNCEAIKENRRYSGFKEIFKNGEMSEPVALAQIVIL